MRVARDAFFPLGKSNGRTLGSKKLLTGSMGIEAVQGPFLETYDRILLCSIFQHTQEQQPNCCPDLLSDADRKKALW